VLRVRRVVGNKAVDLSGEDLAGLRDRHRGGLLLDVGTGDGKYALHRARERPDLLVVGLDANPDRYRRTAARAAAAPAKGGTPNLVLLHAPVERLPIGLIGITELTVLMPWGSLLRAVLEPAAEVLAALTARCRPNTRFRVTINLHAWRPRVPEVGELPEPTASDVRDRLAPAYRAAGWLIDAETAVEQDPTSWSRRLGSTRRHLDVLAISGTIVGTAPVLSSVRAGADD
jgi:16S rRNA (adenine(1408)-N(1))-methyltransferase